MFTLALPVIYHPHAEHEHLADFADTGLAAIVGRVYPDGTADLFIMPPNKEPYWQDKVPYGDGEPQSFHEMRFDSRAEGAGTDGDPAPQGNDAEQQADANQQTGAGAAEARPAEPPPAA